MPAFSANLGFLWQDCSLADATVEPTEVASMRLSAISANESAVDDVSRGHYENRPTNARAEYGSWPLNAGLAAALPDQISAARRAIEQALDYGGRIAP